MLSNEEQEAHLASCNIEDGTVIADRTKQTNKVLPSTSSNASTSESYRASWLLEQHRTSTFWDDWANELDSPVLSSNSASNFYGLGVWLPKRYSSIDFEDTMELIKKYGLQMSFGIGGDDNDSPRVRFDYRWHEDNELDDIFIQVEIPFQ
ncbi:hypothetical protein [Photobacterium nomapromontoriensis]|uniref:hypothetical protein n=1 Tax=Photobacterium nomapromontoriensis TaxID=2910237 RepID=UPI003D0C121A